MKPVWKDCVTITASPSPLQRERPSCLL